MNLDFVLYKAKYYLNFQNSTGNHYYSLANDELINIKMASYFNSIVVNFYPDFSDMQKLLKRINMLKAFQ